MAEALDLLVREFGRLADNQAATNQSVINNGAHIQQVHARIDKVNARLEAIEKSIDGLKDEVDAMDKSVTGIGAPSEGLQSAYGDYREELQGVKSVLAEIKTTVAQSDPVHKAPSNVVEKVLETRTGQAAFISVLIAVSSTLGGGVGSQVAPREDPSAIARQVLDEMAEQESARRAAIPAPLRESVDPRGADIAEQPSFRDDPPQ